MFRNYVQCAVSERGVNKENGYLVRISQETDLAIQSPYQYYFIADQQTLIMFDKLLNTEGKSGYDYLKLSELTNEQFTNLRQYNFQVPLNEQLYNVDSNSKWPWCMSHFEIKNIASEPVMEIPELKEFEEFEDAAVIPSLRKTYNTCGNFATRINQAADTDSIYRNTRSRGK